ncbi:hypothetical protein [Verrucomicrobium sp. BvORR106]|uniref:hypothetical protein n=1 Tax=Verrucomicrobium sp. BvORR106 TaxID=1403819 RepID=UPI00056E16BB|nr:hypothetical protein [Verrucomicrobium sp. BvORR106]
MQANWNIKSRAHECSRTNRPFEEGERFYTAIYFDTVSGEFQRRDVAESAWAEELAERKPFSYWKAEYVRPESLRPKVEITSRESAEDLLRRFVEEDEEHTEHARYILALMLERKKQLVPKETKETEHGKTIIYEHRKSGEVFIIKDPELRLDELAMVQDEVAMLLGFGGPAAEAAAAVGMRITPDGKVENLEKGKKGGKAGKGANVPDQAVADAAPTADEAPVAEEPAASVTAEETSATEVSEPTEAELDEASSHEAHEEVVEEEAETDESLTSEGEASDEEAFANEETELPEDDQAADEPEAPERSA